MKIMAKKVLILSSSPRRGGNSDRLCDRFMAGAQQAGHEVEKIFLKDRRIGYCTGCGACYGGAGPCPQKDDAAGVIGKMVEADVIVMATPVYFYTLSAQMKTLIDRCCARYLEMKGKEFYFILTAAEESVPMMERTVECFRGLLDCLEDPREKGVVYGGGAWRAGDIEGMPAMDEACHGARRINGLKITDYEITGFNSDRRGIIPGHGHAGPDGLRQKGARRLFLT